MKQYNYKAKNANGETFEGMVEAISEDEAVEILRDKDLKVVFLELQKGKLKKKGGGFNIPFFNKVKRKEIVIFSRQLSVMVSANVSLVESLRILIDQTEGEVLKEVVTEISEDVESGMKLSDAIAVHNKIFSNFFVSMIKSGETSGEIDKVLVYLANQEEKDYDLVSKIKGAMIYPVFILSGLSIVGVAMMIFVIPQMTGMLTASGSELPMATKILMGTSDAMRKYWYIMLIGVVALIGGFKYALKTDKGKFFMDSFILKIPVFGNLFKMIYLVRFTQSFSTLISGGVTLTVALKIVSDIVGNRVYKDLIDRTIVEVEDGNSLAVVFLESDEVPKLVSQMMAVGEKTGRINEVLDKVSEFYSREIDNMVANMSHLIEPIIMVIIGVAVGGMVAAVIMPMYQMADAF